MVHLALDDPVRRAEIPEGGGELRGQVSDLYGLTILIDFCNDFFVLFFVLFFVFKNKFHAWFT